MNKTLFLLAGALTLASMTAQAAGTLALTPSTTTVNPGETFVVELRGVGFTEETIGGGADFSWNPDVIDLTGVSISSADWPFVQNSGLLDPTSGTLSELVAVTLGTAKIGDFLIAQLTFIADRPGATTLTVGPSPFQPFSNTVEEPISLSFSGAQITVTAVPEPGTWALMALGLAGLPWLRRRQRAVGG